MADYPHMSMVQRVSQNMAQAQVQRMSQAQIMSLNMLAMSSADLRNEIYSFAEKHPALEIVRDSLESGVSSSHQQLSNSLRFSDNTHYGSSSASALEASDNFQSALESNADDRESLSDHLEHQLNSMNLSADEKELCLKLIYNLDKKGFHILSPLSFLKTDNPIHTEDFLNHCLCLVQNLDPVGCCTGNYRESLFVQAKISGKASSTSLFFLESSEHFEFLNPPQITKIQKKIYDCLAQRKKLIFRSEEEVSVSKEDFTPEKISEALGFIRTLDPFPARNFGSSQSHFIAPDIIVTKNTVAEENAPEFTVSFAREYLPRVEVSKEYTSLIDSTKIKDGDTGIEAERKRAELKFARNSVNEAKVFIESIMYRESTMLKAAQEIVSLQTEFFRKGVRFLVPLRQKDIAEKLGVHETTISRMANSKYLSCEWGIFPVNYFFTNAVGNLNNDGNNDSAVKTGSEEKASMLSKESVKYEIAALLEEHKNDKKALSDQKISDLLAEKGIKVARRTVAKYRGELNINSSYER